MALIFLCHLQPLATVKTDPQPQWRLSSLQPLWPICHTLLWARRPPAPVVYGRELPWAVPPPPWPHPMSVLHPWSVTLCDPCPCLWPPVTPLLSIPHLLTRLSPAVWTRMSRWAMAKYFQNSHESFNSLLLLLLPVDVCDFFGGKGFVFISSIFASRWLQMTKILYSSLECVRFLMTFNWRLSTLLAFHDSN